MKVGELAKSTGLSVRTLHHYEAMGLLPPRERTRAGHRLYGDADVVQLQKILALKQLGMSLEEIRTWLHAHPFEIVDAIRTQRNRVTAQIEMLASMRRRLELIENRMDGAEKVSVDDVLEALEAMAMLEKYYTEEQLKQLEERRRELGEDTIKSVEQEWPDLIAKVQDAMKRGVDPHSPEMRGYGKRWQQLIEMFTGGDAGIAASLEKMYANEPTVNERHGMSKELFAYVAESWK